MVDSVEDTVEVVILDVDVLETWERELFEVNDHAITPSKITIIVESAAMIIVDRFLLSIISYHL